MGARNAWIFAGIAAAAVVAAVLIVRSRPAARGSEATPAEPDRAPALAAGATTPQPARSIPRPTRQAPPPLPEVAIGQRSDDFDAEARDEAWAVEAEAEVRQRLAHLDVSSLDAECRRQQCRIVLTARDQAALGSAITVLGEDTGLYGYADQIVLTGQGSTDEGEAFVVVYAQFDR